MEVTSTETPATATPAIPSATTPPAGATQTASEPTGDSVTTATPIPKPAVKTAVERASEAWEAIRTLSKQREAEKNKQPAAAADEKKEAAASPAATPPTAAAPAEEPISVGFARVAKLERTARESIKASKAAEESANKRIAEMQAKLDAYEQKKARAKLDPEAWAQEGGLTYEDYVQFKLNGAKPTADLKVSKLEDDLAAFKRQQLEAQAAAQKEAQERSTKAHQENYEAWQKAVVDTVRKDTVRWELINQQEAHQLVPAVIQKRWDESKTVLSEIEAADLVEKHLEEQADKLFKAKKFEARFKAVVPAPAVATSSTTSLHNGMSASASPSTSRPRTAAERMERARLAMENARKQ